MGRILALNKILSAKSRTLFDFGAKGKKQDKASKRTLATVAVLLLFLFLAISNGLTSYQFSAMLVVTNQSHLMSLLLGLQPFIVCFFLCGMSILADFFLAEDNHFWLSFPFRIEEIFSAKFIANYISMLIVEAILVLPTYIGFNLAAQPGVLSYIGQIVLLLAIPIVVISLIFILFVLLSRIIDIHKNRKLFQTITAIIFFVIIIGFSLGSVFVDQYVGTNINGLVEMLEKFNQTFRWTSFITVLTDGAFINQSYLSLLLPSLFLVLATFLFLIAYRLAAKFYHRSLFYADSNKHKKARVTQNKPYHTSSPLTAIFKNELHTVFRSPTYVMNVVAPIFILLIIMSISLFTGFSSMQDETFQISQLWQLLFDPRFGFMLPVITAISAFFFTMNFTSSTSISREGNNAQLLKTYPVSTRTILYGKMLLGFVINEVLFGLIVIILGIVGQANILVILSYLILITLINIIINYIGILIDLRFPLLTWTNELVAVKQNKNVLISMTFNTLITILLGLTTFPIFNLGLSMPWAFLIIFTLLTFTIFLIEVYVRKKGHKLYNKIQ